MTIWEYQAVQLPDDIKPESLLGLCQEKGKEGWEFINTVGFQEPPQQMQRMNARGLVEVAQLPGKLVAAAYFKRPAQEGEST